MAEHTVHIRLDSTYYDTLQRMRERERFPPSINAIATALLKSGIDAADGSAGALRALSAPARQEEPGPRRNAVYPAPTAVSLCVCGHPETRHVGGPVGGQCIQQERGSECPCVAFVAGGGGGPVATETPRDRFKRLLATSGSTEAALVRELGLTSRGKLQHALRRGEVPPEVEAWMLRQEGGGR